MSFQYPTNLISIEYWRNPNEKKKLKITWQVINPIFVERRVVLIKLFQASSNNGADTNIKQGFYKRIET